MKNTVLSLVILALFAAGCGDMPPPPAKSVNLSISATEGGNIDLLSGKFSAGSKVTMTANPWDGSKFLRWEIGPAGSKKEQSTKNPLVYTVPDQDTEIKAFFRRLTVQLSASPGGKATKLEESFESGYYVTVEANPDPHYDFRGLLKTPVYPKDSPMPRASLWGGVLLDLSESFEAIFFSEGILPGSPSGKGCLWKGIPLGEKNLRFKFSKWIFRSPLYRLVGRLKRKPAEGENYYGRRFAQSRI